VGIVADSVRRLAAVAFLGVVAAVAPAPAGAASLLLSGHSLVALTGKDGGELLRARGAKLVSPALRLWRVDTKAAIELAPRLEARGLLRYAEPDLTRALSALPSDPLSAPEIGYHLYRVGADRAEPPAPGFPLTIIDTGLDLTHPEFSTRPNLAALNEQRVRNTRLESYHGTIVASTAAAPVDGIGAVGVNPNVPLRVWDSGQLSDASVIAAIEGAVAAGPSVINLSLGGPLPTRPLQEAVLHAIATGSLVVAASGNDFRDGDDAQYPASFPHVLTVGSSDRDDQPSRFSSSSPGLDLVAPGEDIPVQNPTDEGFRVFSGTSFSAPAVAAAAAWVQTARPELTPAQLFEVMRRSARDVFAPGYDTRTGYGVLDIPGALAYPVPPADVLEPNDDVDQVLAGRVFGNAKPPINGLRGGPARVDARLDGGDDRHDVYRVVVPAGREAVLTITADDTVRGTVLATTARSVAAVTPRAPNLNASGRAFRLTFANRMTRQQTVLADLSLPRPEAGRTITYRLSVALRPAPRLRS
jgi:hypothetical protein